MDGAYPIVVVGQKAKGSIHIDVERVPEAVEPEGTQEPVHIRNFCKKKSKNRCWINYRKYTN